MKEYVLGVDGGNTKTDYFLYATDGEFIDALRDVTCSPDHFSDRYEGSYRAMKTALEGLLSKNGLRYENIASAAFGLSGIDVPHEQKDMTSVISRFGIKKFECDNDSYLGIKAGLAKGYGVCSIHGGGTMAGGIDVDGKRLQVGGLWDGFSDEAGGAFLTNRVLSFVYDSLYRFGEATELTQRAFELLGVTDKAEYLEIVSRHYGENTLPMTELLKCLFKAAENNDKVALQIVDKAALSLARSTAGCILNLNFPEEVDIVLAGSLWVKAEIELMLSQYKRYLEELVSNKCNCILLQAPPASGAVLWALELYNGHPAPEAIREKVIQSI